jgi:hypothetical protein
VFEFKTNAINSMNNLVDRSPQLAASIRKLLIEVVYLEERISG